jgi:hypothetical protein
MGGQTALNCALDLAREGVLEQYGVEMIGATARPSTRPRTATSSARRCAHRPRDAARGTSPTAWKRRAAGRRRSASPAIIRRPSPWAAAAAASPTTARSSRRSAARPRPVADLRAADRRVLLGWKEYEMEVVRDRGQLHHRLLDRELRRRWACTPATRSPSPGADADRQGIPDHARRLLAVLREIGVETGGSNVQFAVNPADGRMVVIEMNPRVSRSSALASKATGFPIAKVAAKLAVGYTLDELRNDITGGRHAGLVRADHRLRRHQDPALRVREVPGPMRADHADEVRRRGHGHRPHLPGIAAEGAARAGDRLTGSTIECSTSTRLRQEPIRSCAELRQPAPTHLFVADAFARGHERGRGAGTAHRHRPLVPGPDRGHRRHRAEDQGCAGRLPDDARRDGCAAQAHGLLRRGAWPR